MKAKNLIAACAALAASLGAAAVPADARPMTMHRHHTMHPRMMMRHRMIHRHPMMHRPM